MEAYFRGLKGFLKNYPLTYPQNLWKKTDGWISRIPLHPQWLKKACWRVS
jgi:hypothetical protein